MSHFDPDAYGPVFAPLVAVDRRRPLGAGTPQDASRGALERLMVKSAFAHAARSVAHRDMAECCISGVWLLHDFLDESHTISQSINTASGSFWHGIMHRREGDFSNAKYWFRRVGAHEVFDAIAQRAAELAAERGNTSIVGKVATKSNWDPFAFVDLCESAVCGHDDARQFCLDVQQAEWELLFDYCYQAAVRQ
jgi:hypothetical protein